MVQSLSRIRRKLPSSPLKGVIESRTKAKAMKKKPNLSRNKTSAFLFGRSKDQELTRLKVISFDLDNTIWDNSPVIRNAVSAEYNHMVKNFPSIAILFENRKNYKVLGELRNEVRRLHPDLCHDLNFMRRRTLELLGEKANLTKEEIDELVEGAFNAFNDTRQEVSDFFYPGVIEMLELLKRRGFTVVAVTNGTAQVERIPEIKHLFDHAINGFTAGALKPHKAPFEQILSLTKVQKEEVLHIGDNIVDDVKGSVDFGMKVVWINERQSRVELKGNKKSMIDKNVAKNRLHVATIPSVAQLGVVLKHIGNELQPSL